MTPPRKLHDHTGRPLELGPQLAAGGEGIIYTLPGDVARVAKLYHRPPDADKVEKLRWMVEAASPDLCNFAAWPTATLHDTPGGPLVGFLMPRFVGYRPIHTLYSPAHRRTTFPHADWAFLVHTAMNCAIAFDAIHQRGDVIGDVNQSNILVSEQALVCLIDCDSFQVQARGRLFLCEVGVSPYTPPELQGHSFRGVVRTANHDRFGLAVLIFHLLFMGRHPFAGRFLGAGEMPLEQAIQEFRFVYSRQAAALQMAPPPNVLPLSVLPPELGRLFERAFERGSEAANARPTAAEWRTALAAFEKQLRSCPTDSGHKVPVQVVDCPWCGIVKAGGPNFFLGVAVGALTFAIDAALLARLWERIERVPFRQFQLTLPTAPAGQAATPTPMARQARQVRQLTRVLLAVAGLTFLLQFAFLCYSWRWWLGCLLTWCLLRGLVWLLRQTPAFSEEARRKQALTAARAELQAAVAEWHQVVHRYQETFPKLRTRLKQLRDQYLKLQPQYEAEQPQRERNKEAYFLDQFLRACFLSDHEVEKIGPARKVLLASYGIETAYDIDKEKLAGVRGIGPVLTRNLLAWRTKMQKQFQFDPKATLPETEVRAVVLRYKQMEDTLRSQLQRGAAELEALTTQTEEQLRPINQRIETLLAQANQAEADLKALAS